MNEKCDCGYWASLELLPGFGGFSYYCRGCDRWFPWLPDWIYEDELPEGYPYDEMYPYSKLGADGQGGVRMFPKVTN